MSYLAILKALLWLAGFIGRQVEKSQTEKAFADALLVALDKRADAAVAAADDIRSGRVPIDPNSPARRD